MTDHEPAFQLASMASQPRRSRTLVLVVAGLAALVVALGVTIAVLLTRGPDSQASFPPSYSPAPTASLAPLWITGCADVARALASGSPLDPMRMQIFGGEAAESPDFDVSVSGPLLRTSAELAAAAAGQPDEAKYTKAMRDDAIKLRADCIKAGAITAGS